MILVTGAAGLLGRELLVQLTSAGRAWRGIDLLKYREAGGECLRGDLLMPEDCRRACGGVDTVIHAAARQHHSRPPKWNEEAFFEANVSMTRRLLEAAKQAGVKHFIYISSDMVYGLPQGRPFREEDEARPIGPYGRSKRAGELACLAERSADSCVTILRPRLMIGPGRLGVLQRLFDRVREGKTVPMMGRGEQRYQMVSVADVARACLLTVERPCEGVFNLGSKDPPPVRRLLNGLCERARSGSRLRGLPVKPAEAALWSLHAIRAAPLSPEQFRIASLDYVLDTSLAARRLDWRPEHSDSDMLWSAYQSYVRGM